MNPATTRKLRDVEKQMERLHRQQDRLNEALVASSDHVELSGLGRELGAVRDALAKAEEQWMTLAEAAESAP
jgi:predicted  nucleic acid-binding Zn-ribbon protein